MSITSSVFSSIWFQFSFFLFPHVEVGGHGLVITEADLLILSLWCLENWNLNKLMDVHCIIKKICTLLTSKKLVHILWPWFAL